MYNRRLYRSTSDRMVAGVCGGIAHYFQWDPTLVRVAYVLITLFTAFSGVLAYLILWLVMPAEWEKR
ncbi:MAG: PspC domain-containing protein [Marinifilaceae bacterium]